MLNLKRNSIPETQSNEFSYFEALYRALYSPRLYVDVIKNWRGTGLLYLLLVCFVISIPWSYKTYLKIDDYYKNHVIPAVAKLPELVVTNGQISILTRAPLPVVKHHIIYDQIDKTPFIEIDTSGNKVYFVQTKAKILITNNKIITALPSNKEPQEQTLDKDTNGYITAQNLLEILDNSKRILIFTIFPATVTMIFVAQVFSLYMFSFIGIFLAQVFFKQKLTIKQSMRVCCVAATLELYISCVLNYLNAITGMVGLIMFTTLLLYYAFGVRAYRNSKRILMVS